MLLRQLFDDETYTYTYLLADETSREAILIDPVIGQVDSYLQLLHELGLQLNVAVDTHVHADHITALGLLREKTGCLTYIGNVGEVICADSALTDGQIIKIGEIDLQAIYTPGHTDDSYSFFVKQDNKSYVFTGDTLLIRGTGRTDFQHGSAEDLYDSLHNKLLKLSDDTIVYPGHDYKGWTTSTIGEEKAHNPRLKIQNRSKFVEFMKNVKLPNPKYMDVAVPSNLSCGQRRK